MHQSLVSIIIPCFNAEAYVAEAIQSGLDQTYRRCELIVIDDGSTDNSLAIIRSFGDRVRCETGPNRGGGAARNRGLSLARGRFIKFADADDALYPDALQRQMAATEGLAANEITCAKLVDYDTGATLDHVQDIDPDATVQQRVIWLLSGNIYTPSPLYPVKALERVGGFDERLRQGQEWNLHIRLALAGYAFKMENFTIYRYRRHQGEQRLTYNTLSPAKIGNMVNRHLITAQQIHSHFDGNVPDAIARRVSRLLFSMGRKCARHEQPQMAQQLFTEARKIHSDPRNAGVLPYRMLANVMGDYHAARAGQWFRRKKN